MTREEVEQRVQSVSKLNNGKLAELQSYGAKIDPSSVVVQSLIEYLVPEDDRVYLELIFQEKMAVQLEDALSQVRQAVLTQGLQPSGDSSNLLLPK